MKIIKNIALISLLINIFCINNSKCMEDEDNIETSKYYLPIKIEERREERKDPYLSRKALFVLYTTILFPALNHYLKIIDRGQSFHDATLSSLLGFSTGIFIITAYNYFEEEKKFERKE